MTDLYSTDISSMQRNYDDQDEMLSILNKILADMIVQDREKIITRELQGPIGQRKRNTGSLSGSYSAPNGYGCTSHNKYIPILV
ncbi:3490_t:CDS:2 [Diversispora eburnea]|uniref:3490_t:CDS:1 n=1 Tax=Diversispora eburnea TaxID=1213867 RepID=A0A9N9ADJ3_9GLOM|nr:3490_t:CDS:2 [Diversispora eburnea]